MAGMFKMMKEMKRSPDFSSFPADTVVMLHPGRGPYAPSLSPFSIKLQTYLRMANIPHKVVNSLKMSKKGKTPWIYYNGDEVGDSQFCIEYLNKKFDADLNKSLNDSEKATARAFQKMAEEHLYWGTVLSRALYDKDLKLMKMALKDVPTFVLKKMRKGIMKAGYNQGLGRHSPEDIVRIMTDDFVAISKFLGDKEFMMGPQPTEVDCCIFGQLASAYWQGFETPVESIMKECPNLGAYCERIKERFWPDWDECITHGGTKEAAK